MLTHPLLHILLLRGILAFGNKVAKNDARVIGRLVPPLSPLTHEVRGDPILIILCPNLWTTCAGSCGSAIERSRERQRRARLPLVDIA